MGMRVRHRLLQVRKEVIFVGEMLECAYRGQHTEMFTWKFEPPKAAARTYRSPHSPKREALIA